MKKILKSFVLISGLTGLLLLLLCSIYLLFSSLRNLVPFITSDRIIIIILLAASLCLIWLVFSFGYKRYPFWINLTLGNCFIFLTLFNDNITFLNNDGFTLLFAFFFFLITRYTSRQAFLNSRRFAFMIPLLLITICLGTNLLAEPSEDIQYSGELDYLISKINPAYEKFGHYREDLEAYLLRLSDDKNQEQLIDDLNEKISLMERDLNRFEELKKLNSLNEKEIQKLKDRIGVITLDKGTYENVKKVTTYEQAVRPSSPIVRDFAVKLASAYPGTYYRSSSNNPSPGKQGIKQIKAIHQYIASEWAYINDPLFESSDYYSPADRTIALGLAGDCDDYAILMASCIEAIGGKARILYGTCSEGAHAWAEVYIGNQTAWNEAVSIVGNSSYLTPDGGGYWLCLDWQIGTYSCGNSPQYLYES